MKSFTAGRGELMRSLMNYFLVIDLSCIPGAMYPKVPATADVVSVPPCLEPLIETLVLKILVHEKPQVFARDATEKLYYVIVPDSPQYLNLCKKFLLKPVV